MSKADNKVRLTSVAKMEVNVHLQDKLLVGLGTIAAVKLLLKVKIVKTQSVSDTKLIIRKLFQTIMLKLYCLIVSVCLHSPCGSNGSGGS